MNYANRLDIIWNQWFKTNFYNSESTKIDFKFKQKVVVHVGQAYRLFPPAFPDLPLLPPALPFPFFEDE